jgi:ADP-heptose:LPS heptosyltransferase
MRILFVTSTRLGDAVLSTGLLDHLLRAHPEARFTIACGPVARGVFAHMPRLERLIEVRKRRFSLHWPLLWAQVARTRWDLVVDLRASAIAWMVPARRRVVGRGGRRAGHRLGHIGAVLGLDPPPLPVAWTTTEQEAQAAALLPDGKWLVLGPTANWAGKVWPADRFVAVAQALTAPGAVLEGARIAVIAGPGPLERAMAAPVLEALPGALDLIGNLDVPASAAVLRRAALYIGNDSGLMHLGAAAGAPVVGVFGSTDARQYAPAGPRAVAVSADGPHGAARMEALTPRPVIEAATRLLARLAAGQGAA